MPSMRHSDESLETMSFGSHLEVLRQMLIRVALVVAALAVGIFCIKDITFRLLLAPKDSNFITFRAIERLSDWAASFSGEATGFRFDPYQIELISTDLSAQFMTHLSTSISLAALLSSPYILFELFRFITPALYANERRYSFGIGVCCYVQFILGVLMTYFILAPISFRFLGTYQVDASVKNSITIDSYISTFTGLTFTMGLVFQIPVICWLLAKLGVLDADLMRRYRRHALVAIMIAAAIITPPDIFTLVLVTIPLYMLYEGCIVLIKSASLLNNQHEATSSLESQ